MFGGAVGGLVGTAQGIRYAKANHLDAWSGDARAGIQSLKFTQRQAWKKFGEQYGEFGLKHGKEGMQQYLKIAKGIHKNPVIRHTFPKGGHYAGETWMIRNQQLLRLDPQGYFRSLYYLK